MKTTKLVNVVTEKGEVETETYDASYMWKALTGKLTVTLEIDRKKVTLLVLKDNNYQNFRLSVRADEAIEEQVQKQLEATLKEKEEVEA